MLKEWVSTIGKNGGLSADNTTVLSGAIGVPESKIEVGIGYAFLVDS